MRFILRYIGSLVFAAVVAVVFFAIGALILHTSTEEKETLVE